MRLAHLVADFRKLRHQPTRKRANSELLSRNRPGRRKQVITVFGRLPVKIVIVRSEQVYLSARSTHHDHAVQECWRWKNVFEKFLGRSGPCVAASMPPSFTAPTHALVTPRPYTGLDLMIESPIATKF
jgi:hypothetical protein